MKNGFSEQVIFEKQVLSQLIKAGWFQNDIIINERLYIYKEIAILPDIVLTRNLYPLAILEIKKNIKNIQLDVVIEQLSVYTEFTQVSFAYLTDGLEIYEIILDNKEIKKLDKFPTPEDLLKLRENWQENDPRLYPAIKIEVKTSLIQILAVSRILDSITEGNKYISFYLPIGFGITYVIRQIAWKLLKSDYSRKILYLVPAKALIEQTYQKMSLFGEQILIHEKSIKLSINSQIDIASYDYFSFSKSSNNLQKIDIDYYDCIFIENINYKQKFLISILQHFSHALVVAGSNNEELAPELSSYFGKHTFSYSIQKEIAPENVDINPPEGFEAVRLSDIANISRGINTKINEVVEGKDSELAYIISTKEINEQISIESLNTINISKKSKKDVIPRFSLKTNDIILSVIFAGFNTKISIFNEDNSQLILFSDSVIRIRVNPELANPHQVLDFLKSDTGQLSLRKFASILSGIYRLSIQSLQEIAIFLPTPGSTDNKNRELTVTARAIRQLKEEIIPILETSEVNSINNNTDYSLDNLVIVGEKLRLLASSLVPMSLTERVMTQFPTPIALAYRRFYDSRFNIYEQVLRLKDLFESTSFFTYNLLLADLFRRLDHQKYKFSNKRIRLAYDGYSMAYRMDFINEIFDIAKSNNGKDLFVPELLNTTIVEQGKKLQDLRNQLSHTATVTESRQKKILKEFQPVVEEMIASLDFLQEYRLARIPYFYFEHGQLMRRIEVYRGAVPEQAEEIVKNNLYDIQADNNHLILLDSEDNFLDLYPLYQIIDSEQTKYETHLCFFKHRRAEKRVLEGESIHGSFIIELDGFEDFDKLKVKLSGED